MSADFSIVQGDTDTALTITPQDVTGTAYPVAGAAFAGATVTFQLAWESGPVGGPALLTTAATVLTSGTNYQFQVPGAFFGTASIIPGTYTGAFPIAYASGAVGHTPRPTPLTIVIVAPP